MGGQLEIYCSKPGERRSESKLRYQERSWGKKKEIDRRDTESKNMQGSFITKKQRQATSSHGQESYAVIPKNRGLQLLCVLEARVDEWTMQRPCQLPSHPPRSSRHKKHKC